jgi:hypothetical protein
MVFIQLLLAQVVLEAFQRLTVLLEVIHLFLDRQLLKVLPAQAQIHLNHMVVVAAAVVRMPG